VRHTETRATRRTDKGKLASPPAPRAARKQEERHDAPLPAPIPTGATGLILIDLAQLSANWRALARHVAPAECAAVVKADAYGVGAERVIPALYGAGCRTFFVATLDEAAQARQLASNARIYVLDGLEPGAARETARLDVTPALSNIDDARAWALLADNGTRAPPVALHVDTGLHRLGMSAKEVRELARDAALLERLDISLIMSHLACADEAAHPKNREQLDVFHRLRAGLPPARASLAASDGLMLGKAFHLDLVRPGYALYGGQAAPGRTTPVNAIVRVKARILKVHDVAVGGHIGYAASYRAQSPRRIATIAAGYADGVFRHASATNETPGGAVAIGGQRAPIVGRVSMDLITVDITDIDAPAPQRGDFVDLIGPDLPIEAVGRAAGTIGYEVLTRLGPRFHRVYLDERTDP
jgi:alanine racemase